LLVASTVVAVLAALLEVVVLEVEVTTEAVVEAEMCVEVVTDAVVERDVEAEVVLTVPR
jgi:hypothetical protein